MVTEAQRWKNAGVVPTSGLLAWHMFETANSGDALVLDYSGNARHLTATGLNPPAIQFNVITGQPAWYFNGTTTDPLNYTGAVSVKHAFILASAEEAAFTANRGLLSGVTSGDILASNNSGDTFFDLSLGVTYRKNGTTFLESNQKAPMDEAFGLMEISDPDGFGLDGIQVGKQKNLAGRIWKGWWAEQLIYNRVLTDTERASVMLYFNAKYRTNDLGVPLVFPSDDYLEFRRHRFYAEPPRYQDITDTYEFDDRGRTLNEVADTPPRRWEYQYTGLTPEQVSVFDGFWDAARIVKPFTFRDKHGTDWSDVRIERYNRAHERHVSWQNTVEFDLVRYP